MIPLGLQERLARTRPRFSLTLYKAGLIGAVSLALVVPLALVALPFIEFLNGMAAQPKGKTQMTFGRTHDPEGFGWRVEREPPPGTIPRGYVPYAFADQGIEPADAALVGERLANPLEVTIDEMKEGQKLFEIYCVPCHGRKGNGDGPVTGPDRFPAPPSLHTDQARGYRDGTIFHILTKGTKKMPSYAEMLDPTQRWQVFLFVRALQRAENPTEEDRR